MNNMKTMSLKTLVRFFFSVLFCSALPIALNAQPDDSNTNGETSAREQLFGSWDWVAKTRQPNRGSSESYSLKPQGEQIRISFDRSGRCTIAKNGTVINSTTFQLMEDDARIVFGKWDTPETFQLDEGPFDFEGNLLWIRGEYNDKGATWQLVQAGTSAVTYPTYAPKNKPTLATTTTGNPPVSTTSTKVNPPRTVRKPTTNTQKKKRK